jgi:hypothetical protein
MTGRLARALNGSYAGASDEPYALIREAGTAPGALAALCAQPKSTATCCSGTRLVLRYEVGTPPGTV